MSLFEDRWRRLNVVTGRLFQRVDDTHPLDFYLGKELTGEWLLLLIGDKGRSLSSEYKSVGVTCRERDDGRWALVFRLAKPEVSRLFAILCEDLVEFGREHVDPENAIPVALSRFARWKEFLEVGDSGLLSEAKLRGLVGELLFLREIVIPSRGIHGSLRSWVGPLGAERDFRFDNSEVELKTVHSGSRITVISSAEQLDLDSKPVFLALVCLDDSEKINDGVAFTVIDLVRSLLTQMNSDPEAVALFRSKMQDYGFTEREEYEYQHFRFNGFRMFRVAAGFPAIFRSRLPRGVGDVTWELEIDSISDFECPVSLH